MVSAIVSPWALCPQGQVGSRSGFDSKSPGEIPSGLSVESLDSKCVGEFADCDLD